MGEKHVKVVSDIIELDEWLRFHQHILIDDFLLSRSSDSEGMVEHRCQVCFDRAVDSLVR